MSKKIFILITLLMFILLAGCNKVDPFYEENGKLKIVTTLYPQYDFAKQIGKDKVDVKLLLKPGVESHDYEPTPVEIANISTKANAFIYTSNEMEPWAVKIINSFDGEQLKIVNASQGITLIDTHHEEEETEDEHEEGAYDPHVWLDPINAMMMMDNILKAFIEIDPDNKAFYEENALNYKNQIQALHEDFEALFTDIPEDERIIIHGGHFAFGYFAVRYDLEYISPYSGFSPNATPSSKSITELVEKVNETGTKYIYTEEMVEPRVAETISEQTGANILLLHGVHNITQTELDEGVTYVSIMRQNLQNLQKGFEK